MSNIIVYELEDGTEIQVEVGNIGSGTIKTSHGSKKIQAKVTLDEAWGSVISMCKSIQKKLKEAQADEVEVEFVLKTDGEVGNFVVGKIGIEANYSVKLIWKNNEKSKLQSPELSKPSS